MTPHELLFLLLSNKGFPSCYKGYNVLYDKINCECDIIVDDSVFLIQKIEIMKNLINQMGEYEYKFKSTFNFQFNDQLLLF